MSESDKTKSSATGPTLGEAGVSPDNNEQAIHPFNLASAIIGLSLFGVGAVLLYINKNTIDIRPVFPYFVVCFGLGLCLFSVGDRAHIFNSPIGTLTGAGAIGLILFFTLLKAEKDAQDDSHQLPPGILKIIYPQSKIKGAENPDSATITFSGSSIHGVLDVSNDAYIYKFKMSSIDFANMFADRCPEIHIKYKEGPNHWSVKRDFVSPAGFVTFQIAYKVDENKFYFDKSGSTTTLNWCDEAEKKQESEAKRSADNEIVPPRESAKESISPKTLPQVAAAPANPPEAPLAKAEPAQIDAAKPGVSSQPPAPVGLAPAKPPGTPPAVTLPTVTAPTPTVTVPQVADVATTNKIIGYALFAKLDRNGKLVEPKSRWFDIENKPAALFPAVRFPAPGDVLKSVHIPSVGPPLVGLHRNPFQWDAAQQKHVADLSPVITNIQLGERVKLGGDLIVALDEDSTNGNRRYAYAPIMEIIGRPEMSKVEQFPKTVNPDFVKGYVYLGYLDPNSGEYAQRVFDNYTNPDSVYPAPNDILIATSDVWLRKGPRQWDQVGQAYVNAATVQPIKKGQAIKIAGDVILAKGGESLWAPVGDIYLNGLADVVSR